jgi:hypothetical protein
MVVTVHCHKEESIALVTAIRLDSCLLGDRLLLVVFTFYDLFRVQQSSRSHPRPEMRPKDQWTKFTEIRPQNLPKINLQLVP